MWWLESPGVQNHWSFSVEPRFVGIVWGDEANGSEFLERRDLRRATSKNRIRAGAGGSFLQRWMVRRFADALYLASLRNEFGSGVVVRCLIEGWKCVTVARNVLEVSIGGNGTTGMVRAIGKYTSNGDETTYPRGYVAEIRNGASQVVARQTFRPSERNEFVLAIAPSGMKAVFTWHEFCPDGKRDSARCSNDGRGGIMMDLSGRPK